MTSNPVFLLSTGRSGSTLLQRLLNCHPDLVLWGEHHGFVGDLAHGFLLITNDHTGMVPPTPELNWGPEALLPRYRHPKADLSWANPWSRDEYVEQVRRFIEGYFASRLAPGQRWGFKEIRYNWPGVMEMLHALYPEGHFILLRRNVLAIARSKGKSWAEVAVEDALPVKERTARIRETIATTRAHFQAFDSFCARFPEVCTNVGYEEFVAAPEEGIARILSAVRLDPDTYDWELARRVLATQA
jgi:hypothetical protein